MTTKPKFCESCPISQFTEGYVPPKRAFPAQLIVGEAAGEAEAEKGEPFVGGAGAWLDGMLRQARLKREHFNIINTIGCRPPGNVYPGDPDWTATDWRTARAAIEHCRQHHLLPFLKTRDWQKVIALGGKALEATTSRNGIMLWRGSPLQANWKAADAAPCVMPTIHPAAIARQATMMSVVVRDLQKPIAVPPENYVLYPTLRELQSYTPSVFAFDFEWDPATGAITMCGISDKSFHAVVVPFEHPYIDWLKRLFENAEAIIGHNIVGADTKYFEQLGWNVRAKLWDTMLMQHLLQPDMRHGLNFVASVFTNKVFWKGRGEEKEDDTGILTGTGAQWKTWNSPDAIPRAYGGYGGCDSGDEAFRLYNARDTDASFQCWIPLRNSIEKYGLSNTYWNVSVPVAHIARDMSDAGIRIDGEKLADIALHLRSEIEEKEQLLPEGLKPVWVDVTRQVPAPPGTYSPKKKTCKGLRKSPHEPVIFEFSAPHETRTCEICGAVLTPGKMKEAKIVRIPDRELVRPYNSPQKVMRYAEEAGCKISYNMETGKPSSDKKARLKWGRKNTDLQAQFGLLSEIKKLTTLKQSFAREALLDPVLNPQQRMFFNLMPTGTAEGRFSSAGQREGLDMNIQNQPKVIRKIFVTDEPGWAWLNLDVCQGENMLTAYLAKDYERLERLSDPDYSEHADLASQFFSRKVEKYGENEHLYKAGKSVNHGRNYGLGVRKTMENINAEAGLSLSEADVRELFAIWEKRNKRTAEWQRETIAIAERQGYLENPFGRRRWFQSRDFATKALAFLPASTLADIVIRMMIAHYPARFAKELAELQLATTAEIVQGWKLSIQVHDSLVLQGPAEHWQEQAVRTRAIMTQPWKELGGFVLGADVEMVAPSGPDHRPAWGDCRKVYLD